jgi:hypothetical protein
MRRCDACPVPADRPCLGGTPRFPTFCGWAASGDPVKVGHVVGRSAIAERGRGGEPTGEFPPLLTQARNLAGAVARFVASGLDVATPELRSQRLAICRSDVCGQFVGGRCKLCGCRLAAKVASAVEHCPLDPPLW